MIKPPNFLVKPQRRNTHSVAWMQAEAAFYGERRGKLTRLSAPVPCRIRMKGDMILLDRTVTLKADLAGDNGRIRVSLPKAPQYYFDHYIGYVAAGHFPTLTPGFPC